MGRIFEYQFKPLDLGKKYREQSKFMMTTKCNTETIFSNNIQLVACMQEKECASPNDESKGMKFSEKLHFRPDCCCRLVSAIRSYVNLKSCYRDEQIFEVKFAKMSQLIFITKSIFNRNQQIPEVKFSHMFFTFSFLKK